MDDVHAGFLLGHIFSGGAIVGTLLGWFPAFAAFVALIFYLIQIWESVTIQKLMATRSKALKERKIARLKGKVKVLTGELEALEVTRAAAAEAKEIVAGASAEAEKIITSTPLK